MKMLVDEHIPTLTVRALTSIGHEIRDIRGTPDEGIQDDALWELVQRERRLLITTDKGFTQYRTSEHYGILIVRLRQPNRHKIHQRVMQAIEQVAETDWPGLLVIMRDTVQGVWRTVGSQRS